MFKKILIATDGSKHSQKAAEKGIEMAKLSNGAVTAIYVVDIAKEYAPIGDVSFNIADEVVEGMRNSLMKKGEEATKTVEEMAKKAGVPAQKVVLEGHPASDIMKFAQDSKMDLIVIGSIGVTGLDKFLMGSVAEKIVRNSKMPVLVVR
ncbi:MAG: universal stress protein [Methanothrix sp.]|nr:universal stress protein [Methanothrix sp.]